MRPLETINNVADTLLDFYNELEKGVKSNMNLVKRNMHSKETYIVLDAFMKGFKPSYQKAQEDLDKLMEMLERAL